MLASPTSGYLGYLGYLGIFYGGCCYATTPTLNDTGHQRLGPIVKGYFQNAVLR